MVEEETQMELKEYRSFIDEEMIIIMGQMDSASKIFDHVYLVSKLIFIAIALLFKCSDFGNLGNCFPRMDLCSVGNSTKPEVLELCILNACLLLFMWHARAVPLH